MSLINNLQLVITRPQAQALAWSRSLVESGLMNEADIGLLTLLEIKPLIDEDSRQEIKYQIMDLDLYQKVIFVSQHAVNYAFQWIDDYWPQIPIGVEFLAIGKSTAKLLHEKGVSVADLAVSQTGSMTSEVLLGAPVLQSVAEERILICRGRGGRTLLGDELLKRGARVDYCELYERLLPEDSESQWARVTQNAQQSERPLVISFHSGETFANFLEALSSRESLSVELKARAHILVPSDRVNMLVQEAGFRNVFQAANATDEAMQAGLISISGRL